MKTEIHFRLHDGHVEWWVYSDHSVMFAVGEFIELWDGTTRIMAGFVKDISRRVIFNSETGDIESQVVIVDILDSYLRADK
jgi:hypothetical protein